MSDMCNYDARDAIVKLGKVNGLYFVVWNGHFGKYFVAVENQRNIQTNIYSAIYESFYDLTMNDNEIFKFQLHSNDNWESVLIKLNLEYNLA